MRHVAHPDVRRIPLERADLDDRDLAALSPRLDALNQVLSQDPFSGDFHG